MDSVHNRPSDDGQVVSYGDHAHEPVVLVRASGTAQAAHDCDHHADHRYCEADVRSAGELQDNTDHESDRTQEECREPARNFHEPSLPLAFPRVR